MINHIHHPDTGTHFGRHTSRFRTPTAVVAGLDPAIHAEVVKQRVSRSRKNPHFVIPAKAGIQCGDDELRKQPWIPAYAGMTNVDTLEKELRDGLATKTRSIESQLPDPVIRAAWLLGSSQRKTM